MSPLTVRWGRLAAALTGLLLLLAWPSPAFGHANVVSTEPADGQVLDTAPAQMTVTFNEVVTLAPTGNQLLDAAGQPVAAAFSTRNNVLVVRPGGELGHGSYIVAWRIVSADSHPVSGGFTFAVGAPSASVAAVPQVQQERAVTLARVMVEASRYAGILGLAGIVTLAALIAPPAVGLAGPTGRSLRRAATVFASASCAAAVLLIPIAGLVESGESLGRMLRWSPWRDGLTSPTAAAAGLAVGGSVLAVVAMRRAWSVTAVGGAAAALASLAVVGHTRTFGPPWLVLSADLLHVTAAAMWFGGLIGVGVVLGTRPRPPVLERGAVVARFSGTAGGLVLLVALAGTLLYWRIGYSWAALLTTTYGRLVVLKVGLLVPVLALAAWNRFRLVPRLRARSEAAADLLARTVRIEAGVLGAVLLVTGVLVTQSPPPPAPAASSSVPGQTLDLAVGDEHTARIAVTPARRGVNGLQLTITGPDGQPADLAGEPTLAVALPDVGLGPLRRPLSPTTPGSWEATADLPLPGTWTITVAVPLSRFEQPVVTGNVEVP